MRVALAGRPADVMSALVRDPSTIGGAFTATHAPTPYALADDPFARIFPRTLLRVDGGFVGTMPTPAGPGVQRYAGAPWPWDHFLMEVQTLVPHSNAHLINRLPDSDEAPFT